MRVKARLFPCQWRRILNPGISKVSLIPNRKEMLYLTGMAFGLDGESLSRFKLFWKLCGFRTQLGSVSVCQISRLSAFACMNLWCSFHPLCISGGRLHVECENKNIFCMELNRSPCYKGPMVYLYAKSRRYWVFQNLAISTTKLYLLSMGHRGYTDWGPCKYLGRGSWKWFIKYYSASLVR